MKGIGFVLCLLMVCAVGCEKAAPEQKPAPKKEVVATEADQTPKTGEEQAENAPQPTGEEQAETAPEAAGEELAETRPAGAEHAANPHALPTSLDALFPPAAEAPVFLLAMFGVAGPFEGMMNDLLQEDMEGAKGSYTAFKEAYTNTSKLVPEWTEHFATEPVEALGAALETGDKGQIMGAFGAMAQVCESCHIQRMVPVQAKYHWKPFAQIKVKDPLRGEEVSMRTLMQTLGVTFTGMANDLAQGQPENAQKTFEGFQATFAAMKDTCDQCHDSERTYFIDAEADASVAALGEAVKSGDLGAVQAAAGKVGQEACFKCHLVHMPAAMMQQAMAGGH